MTETHSAAWSPTSPVRHETSRVDYPNAIRRMRQHLGMPLAETARGADTTAGQVMKLEVGERRLTLQWLERLAKSFGCDVLDLIAPVAMTPVAGYLTTNWAVESQRPEARLPGQSDITSVPVPRGIDPANVIALRRETVSRHDLFAGATFFFEEEDETPGAIERHDGSICLVTLRSGRRHVGRVQISAGSGAVTLCGPSSSLNIRDQIASCAPCLTIVTCDSGSRRLCGPKL